MHQGRRAWALLRRVWQNVWLGASACHFGLGGSASWVFGVLGALGPEVTFLTRRPSDAGTTAH